jgi:hypothetical protein
MGREELTRKRDSGEGAQVVDGVELLVVFGMIEGANEVKKRTVSSGVWSATVLESYRKAKG